MARARGGLARLIELIVGLVGTERDSRHRLTEWLASPPVLSPNELGILGCASACGAGKPRRRPQRGLTQRKSLRLL